MDMRVDVESDVTTWVLEQNLTIYEVKELHEQAMGSMPDTGRLVIDGAAVREVDTAGLQWLIAVHGWIEQQGVDVLLEPGNSAIVDLLDLYQAHGLLGLPAILVASTADRAGSNAC